MNAKTQHGLDLVRSSPDDQPDPSADLDERVIAIHTPGLGDLSYLLVAGDEARVVDPQRDADRYLALAEIRDVTITAIAETHVHNDYVSGARELAAATSATIVGPAKAGYHFGHRSVREDDDLQIGDLRLTVLETPGHTPEHCAYLVTPAYGAEEPFAVFTGGSLLVGAAGRSDLLGLERADELGRRQYASLRRLARLPGDLRVLPTHGAGSSCAAGPARAEPTSTIARERMTNPMLRPVGEDRYVSDALDRRSPIPAYFANMAAINRSGPRLIRGRALPAGLSADALSEFVDGGGWVVDARHRFSFAFAHVAGSVNVELAPDFGPRVGAMVPFNEPLALVLPEPLDATLPEAVTQLARIGYDRVIGSLDGGLDAWREAGMATEALETVRATDLDPRAADGPLIIDVRDRWEWDAAHLPHSLSIPLAEIPARTSEIPTDRDLVVICAAGRRAAVAASFLQRAGRRTRFLAAGGAADLLEHAG